MTVPNQDCCAFRIFPAIATTFAGAPVYCEIADSNRCILVGMLLGNEVINEDFAMSLVVPARAIKETLNQLK